MIEVERHFRPEFLNRLEETIVFNPLTHVDLQKIVHLQLDEVRLRLVDHGIDLKLTGPAIDFLIAKGYHEDYGARPLRRAIERYIEDPLAENLLRGRFEDDSTCWVHKREEDEDAFVFLDEEPEESTPATAGA